jgi:hypothetical protein
VCQYCQFGRFGQGRGYCLGDWLPGGREQWVLPGCQSNRDLLQGQWDWQYPVQLLPPPGSPGWEMEGTVLSRADRLAVRRIWAWFTIMADMYFESDVE